MDGLTLGVFETPWMIENMWTKTVIKKYRCKTPNLFVSLDERTLENEGESETKRGLWKWRTLMVHFSFILQNSRNLEELKNCIVDKFWSVYINISKFNLYDVIIFLKLKIYYHKY